MALKFSVSVFIFLLMTALLVLATDGVAAEGGTEISGTLSGSEENIVSAIVDLHIYDGTFMRTIVNDGSGQFQFFLEGVLDEEDLVTVVAISEQTDGQTLTASTQFYYSNYQSINLVLSSTSSSPQKVGDSELVNNVGPYFNYHTASSSTGHTYYPNNALVLKIVHHRTDTWTMNSGEAVIVHSNVYFQVHRPVSLTNSMPTGNIFYDNQQFQHDRITQCVDTSAPGIVLFDDLLITIPEPPLFSVERGSDALFGLWTFNSQLDVIEHLVDVGCEGGPITSWQQTLLPGSVWDSSTLTNFRVVWM